MFGWEPTWDTVVYMGCVTALLWGLWAFITLKEVGEIEWERHLQQKRIEEAWARMTEAVGEVMTAMRAAGKHFAVFAEKMQEVGRAGQGPDDR